MALYGVQEETHSKKQQNGRKMFCDRGNSQWQQVQYMDELKQRETLLDLFDLQQQRSTLSTCICVYVLGCLCR